MPCKIQIRQNITAVVVERTDPVMKDTLERARSVANAVNDDFGTNVVSFSQTFTGRLERKINIPTSLIDEYYDNELDMEEEEEFGPVGEADNLQYQFRAVQKMIDNMAKANQWFKQMGDTDAFWKKVQQDLQIPKEQIELLRESEGITPEEKLASFAANYSFTVETKTAVESSRPYGEDINKGFSQGNYKYWVNYKGEYIKKEKGEGIYNNASGRFIENPQQIITKEEYETAFNITTPTQHYSNLTVPGGTNYTENEIATPQIVPGKKGHAEFATDQGIGWFRSDDKAVEGTGYNPNELYEDEEGNLISGLNRGTPTKTRRILEVQSDLFQKMRDEKVLVKAGSAEEALETWPNVPQRLDIENKFLQLLNKGNHWVNFFVKSIIQDSAKKGYEKVLFPSGDTASKVEGHETLEEFKAVKEARLEELTKLKEKKDNSKELEKLQNRKKEIEKEGISVSNIGYKFNLVNENIGEILLYDKLTNYSLEIKTGMVTNNRLDYAKNEEEAKEIFDRFIKGEEIIPFRKSDTPRSIHNLDITQNNNKILEYIESEIRGLTRIDTEIAQLKQELERVETEGMGALKPIYNFYENVVANVLRKQGYNPKLITDEQGNTWSEVTIETKRDVAPVMLQLEEVKASKSGVETLGKMKEAAKKMGIKFEDLEKYCRENPEIDVNGAVGVADLAKGTIAIAQDREGYALTEEVIHMATAMVEQTNPALITKLISKIGNYKIYKQVLDGYKNNKNYQLANGKPDIRKIKKEAVDKLLAELIINQSEGSTEFPELRELTVRGEFMRLWESILNTISSIFGNTNVNLFESLAEQIVEGDVGNLDDFTLDGIYLQIAPNKVVDDHYNTLIENHSNMILDDKDKKDRHYTYKNERVDTTVTEKVKKGKAPIVTTPEEQEVYDQMQAWGSDGHDFLKGEFTTNLIDENGYARAKQLHNPVTTNLSPAIQQQLRNFARKLIKSYPPGTRFIIEKMVVNKGVKGMIGSTVDFKALVPTVNKDGTEDMFIDTLDWKFTSLKEHDEDIPWYKQGDWKPQMEEYLKMDYDAGAKPHQTRKSRMVPFIVTYGDKVKGKPKSGIVPKSLEIGNLDTTKETKLYLLPVPVNTESTGNEVVDNLVQSLQSQWNKLWERRAGDEIERAKKALDLNELSKAIRQLHLQLNFSPLRDVGETFLKNAAIYIKSLDSIKVDELNRGELNSVLEDLYSYKDSAEKYANLDKAFLSQYPKGKMNKTEKETLSTFRNISRATESMLERLDAFEKQVAVELAVKQGIVSEENKMSVLEAEAAIDGFSASFKEASKLPSKIINLASDLIMKASEVTKRKTAKQIREFGKLLLPLEKIASARGKKAFDMIGKMEDGKMSLIKKLSPEFWDAVSAANKAKSRKFFVDNVNMVEYIKDIEEAIKKGEEDLDNREFDVDPDTATIYRDFAKERLRNKLDIRRPTFNGFDNKSFSYYFNKNIKEEGHYSKEYKEMMSTPEALAVWEFFTQLNRDAKKMGYLGQQGTSFFPLIEATILEKFNQASSTTSQAKDFFQDFYTMTVNEANQYSMIDPETGKPKRQIPKYFTKTNKTVEQLSTDLNKVGALWIQALNDYENSREMEFTLMTLEAVEKGKGSLVMENGQVVMKGGKAVVDLSNTKNAQMLQTVIDDAVYRLNENLDSFGNVNISSITKKFSKDEESEEKNVVAVKKAIKNGDTLVQALAVGLKPLIAIANYFGVNFQAYINAGNMYTWGEFSKNNLKVTTGGLSITEKGLLDLIMPLNENVAQEERRNLAKEQGLAKYLSTWSFTDVMMSTNAFPERRLQYANAVSFNENSMVVNGEIVGIRQSLRKQDSKRKYEKDENGKYIMSEQERKELEKTFESRVQELKESSSLVKVAKIVNDEMTIPGVTEEGLANYTLKIKEYMRELNGQMNPDNKADYRRDTMFSSFMMFKNWIPKLISVRTLDVHKNVQLDEWQYGRSRAFLKTAVYLGKNVIGGMSDIIQGNEAGLKVLDELLQAKKDDHFRKTGQQLEITQEEFNDLIRTQLENQVKELKLLLGILAVVFAAGAAVPPDDATDQEKNMYKWALKGINKISDEVTFFYNPISFETITSGRLLPSVGILSKALKIFQQVGKEGIGLVTGDEEMSKKAHGLKYTLNLIPGLAQFQTEVLPYLYPELAKEMGIRVSPAARKS